MRLVLLVLVLVAMRATAAEIPPTRDVMAYLTARIAATCGKTAPNPGFLATQLRVACLRDHHHDHDWHGCADVAAGAWCAAHAGD